MVFKIANMRPWFKVVAPSVRNDARIQNVQFTDAPAIEAVLREKMVENSLIADLDVTCPCPDASNPSLFWYYTSI